MEHSTELDQLATALAKAQAAFKTADKSKWNPHFKSKYADLGSVVDACRQALADNGLSFVQLPEPCEPGLVTLTTMLMHASGQWLRGTCVMALKDPSPQSYGGGLTYARRYGLSALLGIAADEDDDGEAAMGRGRPQEARQEAPRAAAAPPVNARALEANRNAERPRPPVESGGEARMPQEELAGMQPGDGGPLLCSTDGCANLLTKGQRDVSVGRFGKPLCPVHQRTAGTGNAYGQGA